jgi:hypothetical protein
VKRRGPAVRFSTPAQDAAFAPGYQANGESQFSRRIANPAERPVSLTDSPRPAAPKPPLSHRALIAKTGHNLDKLRRKLAVETDPAQRARLERNAEIAARFLRRLMAEKMRGNGHAVRGPEA